MKMPSLRQVISALLSACCALNAAPAEPIAWLYVQGEGIVHSRNLSREQVAALQQGAPEEGLWYREAGKSYRITDPGALARVRAQSGELGRLSAMRPQPASPQDLEGLRALRDHTQATQRLNKALHEAIQALSRQAIARGAATPVPAAAPRGMLHCAEGHEYEASTGFRFCHRDGKPLKP